MKNCQHCGNPTSSINAVCNDCYDIHFKNLPAPKDWRTKTCETCNFCIRNECRLNPPQQTGSGYSRYPAVIECGMSQLISIQPACSYYKEII